MRFYTVLILRRKENHEEMHVPFMCHVRSLVWCPGEWVGEESSAYLYKCAGSACFWANYTFVCIGSVFELQIVIAGKMLNLADPLPLERERPRWLNTL